MEEIIRLFAQEQINKLLNIIKKQDEVILDQDKLIQAQKEFIDLQKHTIGNLFDSPERQN